MARPRKEHPVEKLTANIAADLKQRLDGYAARAKASQVTVVEQALSAFLDDETGANRPIHLLMTDEMNARLVAYGNKRHDPRRENIARDALKILLTNDDHTQSRQFTVTLTNDALIDRFDVYRHAREWDRSRVAEKALDWYLGEQERTDPQYRAALNANRPRRGRG